MLLGGLAIPVGLDEGNTLAGSHGQVGDRSNGKNGSGEPDDQRPITCLDETMTHQWNNRAFLSTLKAIRLERTKPKAKIKKTVQSALKPRWVAVAKCMSSPGCGSVLIKLEMMKTYVGNTRDGVVRSMVVVTGTAWWEDRDGRGRLEVGHEVHAARQKCAGSERIDRLTLLYVLLHCKD